MSAASDAFDCAELAINRPGQAWANLGDWSRATEYSNAAAALALRLGTSADLHPDDSLLDLGFGMGQQLHLWRTHFGVKRIAGYNPSTLQFQHALTVVAGMDMDLKRKGAQDLACQPRTFDKVLALDCAYHFPQRMRVHQRIFQALKPGGIYACTDLLLDQQRPATSALAVHAICRISGIPHRNLQVQQNYRTRLHASGFQDIRFHDISDEVMLGFARWWARFRRTEQASKLPGAFRRKLGLTAFTLRQCRLRNMLRYVLIVARKPHSAHYGPEAPP